MLAERGGFEPPVDFKGLRRFSKPLLSTTQPPLREMKMVLKSIVPYRRRRFEIRWQRATMLSRKIVPKILKE